MKTLEPYFDTHKSFYGKAFYIEHAHGATLYSYGTPIIEIDCFVNDKTYEHTWYVRKLWNGYSATTQRHIVEFCRQWLWRQRDKMTFNKEWFESLPFDTLTEIK